MPASNCGHLRLDYLCLTGKCPKAVPLWIVIGLHCLSAISARIECISYVLGSRAISVRKFTVAEELCCNTKKDGDEMRFKLNGLCGGISSSVCNVCLCLGFPLYRFT